MPAPIIEPRTSLQVATEDEAFTLQLAAFESPSSWAVVGLPAGLSLNTSTGAVTGTPTTPGYYQVKFTATNGSGSDSVMILFYVKASVESVDGFAYAMDLDFDSRRLSLPAIGNSQPAARPPVGGGTSAPLGTWISGDRFLLSFAVKFGGLGRDLDLNRITVRWRKDADETYLDLTPDPTTVTQVGTGAAARYTVPVYVDPDLVFPVLDGEQDGGASRVSGYLQVIAESANDARDYDETLSPQTIATLDEGDTVTKTFNVVLGSENEITETVRYTLAVALLLPSDPDNGVELSQTVSVTWNGSAFVIGDVTGSDTGTGTPSVAGTWAATLEIDSITADAEGFDVAAKVTTNTPSPTGKYVDILDTFGGYSGAFDIGFFGEANPTFVYDGITDPEIVFQGESSVVIGFPQVISNNSSREALESQFAGEIGETPSIEFRRNGSVDVMRIIFETGTAVETVVFEGESYTPSNYPPQPDYTNASVTCRVTGIEMPENGFRAASQVTAFDLEDSLG